MKKPLGQRDRGAMRSCFGPGEFGFWLPATFLIFLIIGAVMRHLPPAIPLAYLVLGGTSVILYARDKGKAQRTEWRTPESVLHLFDVLGGWPGGLLAQRIYRHKTRKVSFQVIFWLSATAHLAAWVWIFLSIPAEQDLRRFATRVIRTALAELTALAS